MANRLFYNYFIKNEINIFYNSLSKINVENIHDARAKYYDLKRQLNNVDFIFFDRLQRKDLLDKISKIREKIAEAELEEELTKSKENFGFLKKSV